MEQGGLSTEALQRLERLVALRDQGALSDAEFQDQKSRILSAATGLASSTKPAKYVGSGRAGSGWPRPIIDEPQSWLRRNRSWAVTGALGLLLVFVGVQLWLPVERVSTPPVPAGIAQASAPPITSLTSSPAKKAPPLPIDTAKEMRASGWDETSPDGDGCMMERRGERDNGLNYVFIYPGGDKPTYELSFTSSRYQLDDGATETAENSPGLKLAVLLDGHRIPAILQNHFGEFWEVEIPLTRASRDQIARAKVIGLQLGPEVIARETIQPNPTSIATVERCLKL